MTIPSPRRRRALSYPMLLAMLAVATSIPAAGAPQGPLTKQPPASTLGVWRQTEGGRYLTISAEAADFYHFNKFICYKDEPASGKPLSETYVMYRLEDEGSKLTLFRYDLAGRFDDFFARDEFKRVQSLPPAAVARPGEDARLKEPEFIFEVVWHHFDEQYAFFGRRGFDWQERYRRFRPRVTNKTNNEDIYNILTEMLAGLGDSHTRIYWDKKKEPFRSGVSRVSEYLDAAFAKQAIFKDAPRFRRDWATKQKSAVESELADGPLSRAAAGRIRWGKLKGNVGYMELDVLSGFGPPGSKREEEMGILEGEIDRIVAAFQGCRAVIIDLSFNQGGFDPFGAVIASRFADRRRHVLSTYSMGEDPSSARALLIGPGGPQQFTNPVYVLTSNSTVSAGETLTLMLLAFPHVKQAGETTRGCLSSLLNKGMPNEFHVTLSNEFWLTPDGKVPEGRGIKPAVEFPVFEEANLMTSYPGAVRRVLSLARE